MLVAIAVLEPVKTKCAQGSSAIVSARDCVSRMPSGSLKTNLGNNMETLGGAVADTLDEVNTGERHLNLSYITIIFSNCFTSKM